MKKKWTRPFFSQEDHVLRQEIKEIIKNRKEGKKIVTEKEYARISELGMGMKNYTTINRIMSASGATHISQIIPQVLKKLSTA